MTSSVSHIFVEISTLSLCKVTSATEVFMNSFSSGSVWVQPKQFNQIKVCTLKAVWSCCFSATRGRFVALIGNEALFKWPYWDKFEL